MKNEARLYSPLSHWKILIVP